MMRATLWMMLMVMAMAMAMACVADPDLDEQTLALEWQDGGGAPDSSSNRDAGDASTGDAGPNADGNQGGNAPPCTILGVSTAFRVQQESQVPGANSGWVMLIVTDNGNKLQHFENGPQVGEVIKDVRHKYSFNGGKPAADVTAYRGAGPKKHVPYERWTLDFENCAKTLLIRKGANIANPRPIDARL